MAMATGVLPLPPTVRLPTQITGRPGSKGVANLAFSATLSPYSAPSGASARAATPRRRQNSGARIEHLFQMGDRAIHRACHGGGTARCGSAGCRGGRGIGEKPRCLAGNVAAAVDL